MSVNRYEGIEAAPRGASGISYARSKGIVLPFILFYKRLFERGSRIDQRAKWEWMISSSVVIFLTKLIRYFFVWKRASRVRREHPIVHDSVMLLTTFGIQRIVCTDFSFHEGVSVWDVPAKLEVITGEEIVLRNCLTTTRNNWLNGSIGGFFNLRLISLPYFVLSDVKPGKTWVLVCCCSSKGPDMRDASLGLGSIFAPFILFGSRSSLLGGRSYNDIWLWSDYVVRRYC